ncbi:MAG: 50S ribosomal protein L23 [SAR324 cluster bacterium]|nr:50S ribosomal protein L23 [SAR324 cluster bacterium]
MTSQYRLIKQPYITEKVMYMREMNNKVVFKVRGDVTKIELKKAVEKIFSVTVENVNTINVKGKKKRQGLIQGQRSDWKKAIITLKEGDSIEYFEGG